MNSPIIAPDSRTRVPTGAKWTPNGMVIPIYCATCHKPGGYVPEENMTFVCWLCDDCYHANGPLLNTTVMPDEVFWQEVKDAQVTKYGRERTAQEVIAALSDPESLESKLARDRARLTPNASQ